MVVARGLSLLQQGQAHHLQQQWQDHQKLGSSEIFWQSKTDRESHLWPSGWEHRETLKLMEHSQ